MSLPSFQLVCLSGLRRRLAPRFRCYSQLLYLSPFRLWGDFTQNTFVSSFLDAAFHFSGYKNGVFTRFIEPVNVILSDNSTLPLHLFKRLQLQLTEAVMLGLKEAGTSYDACFLTKLHVEIFPEDGMELLGPDSKFSRRIRRIQKKLENLSDDEFWEDGGAIEDLRAQVVKGQQRMQGSFSSMIHHSACQVLSKQH